MFARMGENVKQYRKKRKDKSLMVRFLNVFVSK